MKNLNGIRFTGDRTLRYTADEIDAMFDTYEIGAYTFMLLSLLYPNLKYSQKDSIKIICIRIQDLKKERLKT